MIAHVQNGVMYAAFLTQNRFNSARSLPREEKKGSLDKERNYSHPRRDHRDLADYCVVPLRELESRAPISSYILLGMK